MLGIKIEGPVAFNIVAKGEDNAAWLVTGNTLYSVDLKTGKAMDLVIPTTLLARADEVIE